MSNLHHMVDGLLEDLEHNIRMLYFGKKDPSSTRDTDYGLKFPRDSSSCYNTPGNWPSCKSESVLALAIELDVVKRVDRRTRLVQAAIDEVLEQGERRWLLLAHSDGIVNCLVSSF
jgi:hypothetical protein